MRHRKERLPRPRTDDGSAAGAQTVDLNRYFFADRRQFQQFLPIAIVTRTVGAFAMALGFVAWAR